ncbi:MBL fold metallo-hydrolase [Nocardioides pacificus]
MGGLHPDDAALLPARYGAGISDLLDEMAGLPPICGVPEDELQALSRAWLPTAAYVRQAEPDRLIRDGDRLALPGWDLRAVHTLGHSPGHLYFHEHRGHVLFSGDHVLPRITPNIEVHAQSAGNPLADFVDSLARVSGLDRELDEALPAQEYRLAGLAAHVSTLVGHHDARLVEIRAALAGATDGLGAGRRADLVATPGAGLRCGTAVAETWRTSSYWRAGEGGAGRETP